MLPRILLLCITLLMSFHSLAAKKPIIRLGVLAFGTVNWELTALKNEGLAKKFDLHIQFIANPQAGKIALQAGSVDMIVADWIWVSKLRADGADYRFYPYSTTAGALMVAEKSKIYTLEDLRGKKLGIAGGELDKNWLLLQALVQQQLHFSIADELEKVYGAPPLLNQQLLQNRVDGLLNYWHYAARLEAKGYYPLITGQQIIQSLGINVAMPTLGYVFKNSWAKANKTAVQRFFKATAQAKNLLCDTTEAWQKITSLVKADNKTTENLLKQRFCEGRIKQWGSEQQQAAEKIYLLLRETSQQRLTGSSKTLSKGIFWGLKKD